jgi:hypothetical protein
MESYVRRIFLCTPGGPVLPRKLLYIDTAQAAYSRLVRMLQDVNTFKTKKRHK